MKYSTPSSAEFKNDGSIYTRTHFYRNEIVLKLSDDIGQLREGR
jgi:hypothetical protein